MEKENVLQALAGAGAGLSSALLVNPLDVVKIRLQNQVTQSPGTYNTLVHITKEEGFKGLFRGISGTAIAYTVDRAMWFPIYHTLKLKWARVLQTSQDSFWCQFNSSISASFVAVLIANPLWVVRTRIMTQPARPCASAKYYYNSVFHGLQSIIQQEGWPSLYKGLGPSFLGISHVAVQFPLYEQLKIFLRESQPDQKELSYSSILLASSLSKMVASITTYPHEVIRTRLQTQISNSGPIRYKSLRQSAALIFKDEGISGFYKGLGTNLVRTVPASAISLLLYEFLIIELS